MSASLVAVAYIGAAILFILSLGGRLEGRGESPYVLAASGQPAPGLEALEEELARRLQEIAAR